jgi:hypothetical protein
MDRMLRETISAARSRLTRSFSSAGMLAFFGGFRFALAPLRFCGCGVCGTLASGVETLSCECRLRGFDAKFLWLLTVAASGSVANGSKS